MKEEIKMPEVNAIIENSQTAVTITDREIELLKNSVLKALEYENFEGKAEVNITLTDNDEIKKLNNEFRKIDRETDVLSFPLCENGEYDINYSTGAKLLGDIVISVEKAKEQAAEYGHSFEREISFLTVHSTLHLLGYDHINSEEEEKVMFKKQDDVMKILKLER